MQACIAEEIRQENDFLFKEAKSLESDESLEQT